MTAEVGALMQPAKVRSLPIGISEKRSPLLVNTTGCYKRKSVASK